MPLAAGKDRSSFLMDTASVAKLTLTSLKAWSKKIPTMIVRKPLSVPITSSVPMCSHSLKRIAEQESTDVVKNT